MGFETSENRLFWFDITAEELFAEKPQARCRLKNENTESRNLLELNEYLVAHLQQLYVLAHPINPHNNMSISLTKKQVSEWERLYFKSKVEMQNKTKILLHSRIN